MFNNSSNSASGKGGNIIILFSEPTLADALLPQAFNTSKKFFFLPAPWAKKHAGAGEKDDTKVIRG
jgi:hypothetical protein